MPSQPGDRERDEAVALFEARRRLQWGGAAVMLDALMFMLTRARGYVDPDDSLLGYFMLTGFALWIVGLAALHALQTGRPSSIKEPGPKISPEREASTRSRHQTTR